MKKPQASIVLPVHNQADHIVKVVEGNLAALGLLNLDVELLLVVNASSDDSARLCSALARRDRRVRVLVSELGGWGRAVKLGIAAARGPVIGYANSSRTSPADLAALLLRHALEPGQVLKADRRERGNWLRMAGSALFNLQCRLLFGVRSRDVNGSPKFFPRRFTRLLELRRDDDLIDAEFNAVCRREGYPVVEAPIFSSRRHGGKSTTGLRSAFKMYAGAFGLWLSMREGR